MTGEHSLTSAPISLKTKSKLLDVAYAAFHDLTLLLKPHFSGGLTVPQRWVITCQVSSSFKTFYLSCPSPFLPDLTCHPGTCQLLLVLQVSTELSPSPMPTQVQLGAPPTYSHNPLYIPSDTLHLICVPNPTDWKIPRKQGMCGLFTTAFPVFHMIKLSEYG